MPFNVLRLILLMAVSAICTGCEPDSPDKPVAPSAADAFAITGSTMGTTYQVKFSSLPTGASLSEIQSGIDAILGRIDHAMSTYRSDSEVSRFNAISDDEWFPISRDTFIVLAEAQRVSNLSAGAFDITVGPLVRLWRFDGAEQHSQLPTDAQIEQVREHVSYLNLVLFDAPPRLHKVTPRVRIDLSAIAKGFAVDKVAAVAASLSPRGYMVEIGGEIRTAGVDANGGPWSIGIESPVAHRRAIHRVVRLHDRAMATSGSYRNFHELDGKRYSHTIDPKTGRPVEHDAASVTVIADTCMFADAMATAMMVLGPDNGLALAEELNLAVLFITQDASGAFAERSSSQFEAMLKAGGDVADR